MKTGFTPARIVLCVFAMVLFVSAGALAGERDTIGIFSDGKLAPGITMEHGQVQDGMIVTDPMSKESVFAVRGLDVEIADKDLAQVWFKIVDTGGRDFQPGYAEIEVVTSRNGPINIEWFPFRAYDKNGPKYMTESCSRSQIYAEHPDGAYYGKITGFMIRTDAPKGMHITQMEINIDKTMGARYPDDRKPDANWKNGKIQDVFAVSGSDRVCLQETKSPLMAGNSVWKDGKVVLSGARNEIVPFQVVMQSADGTDGVNDVNVVFTGVKNGDAAIDNSKAERPADPYDYVGRYIQLYRSRYIQYDKDASMERGPKDMLGKWIPEIQIPFEAKWGGAPFVIFPNETQSVWIDTYIPMEAKSGVYSGQVEVTVGGKMVKSLPVELTVYDFALPNKPSTHAMMFGAPSAAKHGLKAGTPEYQKLEATYRRFFRHNYTEMFKGIGAKVTDKELADAGEWRLGSGEIYTRKEGYEGPGYELPAPIIFITMYGGGLKPFGGPDPYGDEESWHKALLKYQQIVEKYAPGAMIAWYAWDEPSHAFFGGIEAFKKWMNIVAPWVHSFNDKYHANVKIYSTTNYQVAKDIPGLDMYQGSRAQAAEMKKEGHINVHYNGPQGLAYPAAALRIVGWQAFNEDTSIWWMWEWSDYQAAFDEYRDAYNFSNQYGEVGAGIGMFVYPGTDVFIKKRSPGLDGPVPGVRFFNWRQGFIDYEYLAAASKIDAEATMKIASGIASGARLNQGLPNEAGSTGLVTDSERYAAARKALADIIMKGGNAPATRAAPATRQARGGMQRIRPEYNNEYINNPHKGTTTFQRFNGDPLYPTMRWDDSKGPLEFLAPKNADLSNDQYPPTRISYCRWAWRIIEPEKGKIRFDIIDAALKTAHDRGQTLQLRMQPWVGPEDLPDWYYALGGTRQGGATTRPSAAAVVATPAAATPTSAPTTARARGPRFREADFNNPLYVQQWGDFIRALGKRYDGHPDLESFDVAYAGQFGEEGGNATYETAAKLVDVYREAFVKTDLLLMLGTPGCKYASTLKDRHFGWRADCFGDLRMGRDQSTPRNLSWNHSYDAYPQQVAETIAPDAWKYAPVTYETCGTVSSWKRGNYDLDWIIEQGYKYHMSVFMPKSVVIPDEWMGKIMEFNKRIGYRFSIHQMNLPTEARPGQEIETVVTIDNKGCAPIYRPYHFAFRFSQGEKSYVVKLKQDIRTWMPDLTFFREKFVFPPQLEIGKEVKVSCAIVNDQDQPVVKLAIKPLAVNGWHELAKMGASETDSRPFD